MITLRSTLWVNVARALVYNSPSVWRIVTIVPGDPAPDERLLWKLLPKEKQAAAQADAEHRGRF